MTENKGPFVEPEDVIEGIRLWICKHHQSNNAAAARAIGMTAPEIGNALLGKIPIPKKLWKAAGYQLFTEHIRIRKYLKVGDDDD